MDENEKGISKEYFMKTLLKLLYLNIISREQGIKDNDFRYLVKIERELFYDD